jgi:hypothetical protein
MLQVGTVTKDERNNPYSSSLQILQSLPLHIYKTGKDQISSTDSPNNKSRNGNQQQHKKPLKQRRCLGGNLAHHQKASRVLAGLSVEKRPWQESVASNGDV